jgi:hypothetical protein
VVISGVKSFSGNSHGSTGLNVSQLCDNSRCKAFIVHSECFGRVASMVFVLNSLSSPCCRMITLTLQCVNC